MASITDVVKKLYYNPSVSSHTAECTPAIAKSTAI